MNASPVRSRAPVPRLMLAGALTMSFGCATYEPSPLPPPEDLAAAPSPDLDRLEVAASEFEHPLLAPVTLDLSDGLTPDEAAVLAVLANPDLQAVRDAHGIAAAQLIGAGLLPNPVLDAGLDHPHGAGSDGTVNAYTVGLGVDIKPLILRSAKVAEASAQIESVDLSIAWQEWQVARAARLDAIRIAGITRRLQSIEEELELEAGIVDVLQSAMTTGDATVQDVGLHRSALERLRQLHGDLTRSLTQTRIELNYLIGLPPESELVIVDQTPETAAEWTSIADPETLARIAAASRLDLDALRRGYDAEEARVRGAVLSQFPSLSVGIVGHRDESALNFLGGFVTLELPIFNRAQAEIALERATRTRMQHEYTARIATIRSEIAALSAADELLASQISEAQGGIAALFGVERAEAAGVAMGDVDHISYLVVRSTLFRLRLQLLVLTQARMETREALKTAVGGNIDEPAQGSRDEEIRGTS